jgi:hypothetical protein
MFCTLIFVLINVGMNYLKIYFHKEKTIDTY